MPAPGSRAPAARSDTMSIPHGQGKGRDSGDRDWREGQHGSDRALVAAMLACLWDRPKDIQHGIRRARQADCSQTRPYCLRVSLTRSASRDLSQGSAATEQQAREKRAGEATRAKGRGWLAAKRRATRRLMRQRSTTSIPSWNLVLAAGYRGANHASGERQRVGASAGASERSAASLDISIAVGTIGRRLSLEAFGTSAS